jgi:hypothetical protein
MEWNRGEGVQSSPDMHIHPCQSAAQFHLGPILYHKLQTASNIRKSTKSPKRVNAVKLRTNRKHTSNIKTS